MKWIFKAVVILLIFIFSAMAAEKPGLYMPLNLQKAYKNGTRSYDGEPGSAYWQNYSQYKIKVKLEPSTRILTGSETIVYHNESPDTLRRLVIRLYQDIFKKGNLRDWQVSSEDLHDGVQISKLLVDDKPVELKGKTTPVRRSGTNLFLKLEDSLPPGQSIELKFDWQVRLPHKSNIRMGTYDSTSFHVAYWYPQMAVYDDIQGWDSYNYSGLQEFYNDFSDYEVEITVPRGFVVWATGRLQNIDRVLEPEYKKRYQKALTSGEIVRVITETDLQKGEITKPNEWNTWKYAAQGVPDFAFSTSDHYLWDLTSAVADSQTGRRVLIGAAYKSKSKDFYEVAEIAKKAILYFSTVMPGVPFPYPSLTVFNGQGGMEFPMMVNDGSSGELWGTIHVTSHEIAHTYFPFMMGINEQKYAWMDEGWATMLPFAFQQKEAPGYDPIKRTSDRYLNVAGTEFDIPMIVPTVVYGSHSRSSYRNASYNRSGIAYYLLKEMLGEKEFLKALQTYMERWRGKHPIPYDFFFTFNNATGEDLNWFWKPWFFDFGYPDLALKLKEKNGKNLLVEVQKKGLLPVPVYLKVVSADSSERVIQKSMRVWRDGKQAITIPVKADKKVLRIELGNAHIPDVKPDDNILKIGE
ncbi:MAG: M1 family metallopeptidase [Calditrichaeota bacterium]|nr:M1 family metallopeptidase [Calditrichota bacterium]